MALTPDELPNLIFGAGEVVLAFALLLLGANQRAAKAFALVLGTRGFLVLTRLLARVADDPAAADFWTRCSIYLFTPLLLATLLFAAVYPRARRGVPRPPGDLALFLGLGAVVDLLYLTDHSLYWGSAASPAGEADGPLALLANVLVGYAAVAFVLARDWVKEPRTATRSSLFLVSLGFALAPAYSGVPLEVPGGSPAHVVVTLLPFAIILALAAFLAITTAHAKDSTLRRRGRLYLLLVAAAMGSNLPLFLLPAGPTWEAVDTFFAGLWRLPQPLLVTYALLRHQLLGIDLKLQWTIKQSTVAAAFIGVFFVVSEGAQVFFAETAGSEYLGILATGALIFTLAPLQRAAERLAKAAIPAAPAGDGLATEDGAARASFYRDQLRLAWRDGVMTPRERMLLGNLRVHLGIPAEEAERIERELHGPEPQPGVPGQAGKR